MVEDWPTDFAVGQGSGHDCTEQNGTGCLSPISQPIKKGNNFVQQRSRQENGYLYG
jgi:hypothetical protein